MVKHLEKEDFNELIKNGTTLVDFYAEWCGPCKMLGPVLESIASENHNFKIVKVDVDKHEDLARTYTIMSVPTLIVFKDGEIKKVFSGFMPKDELLRQMEGI